MTDEEILRCGRGIGMLPADDRMRRQCEALWETGAMRRDDVVPYVYTTQDGVVPNEPEDEDDDGTDTVLRAV